MFLHKRYKLSLGVHLFLCRIFIRCVNLSNCVLGKSLAQIAEGLFPKCEIRILMVGLDASGKTTILHKLKLGDILLTAPTIGFNVETVDYRNINFNIWDVGGQSKIRPLWRHYFQNTQAIVFVVDSKDRGRISEARNELHRILDDDELKNTAVLIFANKQDLPDAMPTIEVAEKLALYSMGQRPWFIQSASAVTGDGLYEGLDWLAETIIYKRQ